MRVRRKAWAISAEFEYGRRLLGRFMFGHEAPLWLGGYTVATFAKRETARWHLRRLKRSNLFQRLYRNARVERVWITVEN